MSCDCDDVPADGQLPWTGYWPGTQECVELGWFAKRIPGKDGWHPCDPDEPGAAPDLNRLHQDATWNRDQKRFLKK